MNERSSTDSVEQGAVEEQQAGGSRILNWVRQQVFQMGVLLGLLGLCVFFTVMSPYFLTFDNMMNVARQISMIGIISVGMTFVLITAGIDLSVGSIVALGGCITAGLLRDGCPIPLGILAGLLFGLLSGLVNGLLVTKGGLPAFVATLASMSVWMGSQPQLAKAVGSLPVVLTVLLAFVGAVALYTDPSLVSRWAFWIVLAKDLAIGIACLMLGLVIGCGTA